MKIILSTIFIFVLLLLSISFKTWIDDDSKTSFMENLFLAFVSLLILSVFVFLSLYTIFYIFT